MSKIRLTLLSSLLLLPLFLYAQGGLQVASDTLAWKAENLTDITTDSTGTNNSEFFTYGSSKIVWTQTGGAGKTIFEFTVTDVDDHWSTNSYILFTTTRKNKTQTFRFEQLNGVAKITVTFPLTDGTRTLEFDIDNVSPFPAQP